jgi:hypothetical protein
MSRKAWRRVLSPVGLACVYAAMELLHIAGHGPGNPLYWAVALAMTMTFRVIIALYDDWQAEQEGG